MAFCKCCSLDALLRNTRRRSINCHLGFTFSFQIGRREGERDSIRSRVNNRIKRNGIPCVKTQTHTQWRFIIIIFSHPDQKKKNEEREGQNSRKKSKKLFVCVRHGFFHGDCVANWHRPVSLIFLLLLLHFDDIVCAPRVSCRRLRSRDRRRKDNRRSQTMSARLPTTPKNAGQ